MNCPVDYALEVDDLLQFLGVLGIEGVLLCHLVSLADEVEVLQPAVQGIVVLELHVIPFWDCSVGLFLDYPVLG